MARGATLVDRMRDNPLDWRIEDIERACAAFGVSLLPPRGGSHYKVTHPRMAAILTIPARRPIKPVYIRELVRFIDAVRRLEP